MLRKVFMVGSFAALLMGIAASTASAKVHVDLNLGVAPGYPVYAPQPYPYYPAYDGYDDYDDFDSGDCGYEYISVKKWNRYHTRFRIEHRRVWACH